MSIFDPEPLKNEQKQLINAEADRDFIARAAFSDLQAGTRYRCRTRIGRDAKFKLLISPTPMVGPDDVRKTDNHVNLRGFRHERDELLYQHAKQ